MMCRIIRPVGNGVNLFEVSFEKCNFVSESLLAFVDDCKEDLGKVVDRLRKREFSFVLYDFERFFYEEDSSDMTRTFGEIILSNAENSDNYIAFSSEFSDGQFGKISNATGQIAHDYEMRLKHFTKTYNSFLDSFLDYDVAMVNCRMYVKGWRDKITRTLRS